MDLRIPRDITDAPPQYIISFALRVGALTASDRDNQRLLLLASESEGQLSRLAKLLKESDMRLDHRSMREFFDGLESSSYLLIDAWPRELRLVSDLSRQPYMELEDEFCEVVRKNRERSPDRPVVH